MNIENIIDLIINWILGSGSKIVLILIVAYISHLLIVKLVERSIRKVIASKDGESKIAEKRREETLIKIFHGTIHVILIIVVLLMILSEFGVDIGPLIAGAGVVGIAVGFGGQYLIKDLISGFFMILENQLRVGDVVEVAGVSGTVEDITLRKVVVRDIDGSVHHVPNGEIKLVSNKTRIFSKINLSIGIGYESDLNKVEKIINKIGEEVAKEYEDKIKVAPGFLRIDELADSAVIIKVVGETTPGDHWEIAGELRKRILEKFRKEGIDIPYPQLVITNKN